MLARDFFNYSVATVFTDSGTLRTGFSFSVCTELVREYLSLEYMHPPQSSSVDVHMQ